MTSHFKCIYPPPFLTSSSTVITADWCKDNSLILIFMISSIKLWMSHAYIYVLGQNINMNWILLKSEREINRVSRYRYMEISDNILFYLYVDILLLHSILDSRTASHNTFQINWTDLLIVTAGKRLASVFLEGRKKHKKSSKVRKPITQ